MNFPPAARIIFLVAVSTGSLFSPGCALLKDRPDPQVVRAKENHAAFRAQPGWRKKTYRDENLIGLAAAGNTAVEIALREQRGLLLVNRAIAMDFPVATGRPGHTTPKGSYKILDKKKEYSSNLYGRIESGDGATVVSDADTREDAVPEGARFVGASMPYWMRMTPTGLGMHVGHVPGHRPASHGCIRLKRDAATQLFAILALGTPVTVDSFAPTLGGPVGLDSVVIGELSEKPSTDRAVSRPKPAVSPSPAPTPSADPGTATNIVVPPAVDETLAPAEPSTPLPSTPQVPEPAPTPPAAQPAASPSA